MGSVTDLLGGLPPFPATDFTEFGPVEIQPLSRYQKLTGGFLGRNWVAVPHVTHHDEIDVTDIEARRADWNRQHPDARVSMPVLVVKALVAALRAFPHFNASLTDDGSALVLKGYFNIGVAVDTPNGLLVPVIRGCDAKTLSEIARDLTYLAEKARGKGLSLAEMSGSSISLSSLGHIGGTAFTPIIAAPDVAILGMVKAREAPRRGEGDELEWRTMLPLSLSYDHRVINGADGARFLRFLEGALNDPDLFGSAEGQET